MRLLFDRAEEITWTRFVQLVNELYPVSDKEPEKQVDRQQDLDDYPEVTGGRSIKTDTAHFKIGGVRNIPDMEILAYFVHFPYVNLKAAPGNKKPYYVLLEDMIEPISLTGIDGKGKQ